MEDIGKISFIGAGKMATAIVCGLLRKDYPAKNIRAFDISEAASANFANETDIQPAALLSEALSSADIVVAAVKPQDIPDVLHHASELIKDKLLISIAAGIQLESLSEYSGCKKVIRVMCNTPALIGTGASAFACAKGVTDQEALKAEAILNSIGIVYEVEEKFLDAITGLSGSGPAFVFEFIQSLADGAVNAGLPRNLAREYAAQTVFGAAKMVLESETHPCELKDQVTSPAGTTAKGLEVLYKGAFKGIVSDAVYQAAKRSKELGDA